VPLEGAGDSEEVARCLYYWRAEFPESEEEDAEAVLSGGGTHLTTREEGISQSRTLTV
jgi:hypothetical protein